MPFEVNVSHSSLVTCGGYVACKACVWVLLVSGSWQQPLKNALKQLHEEGHKVAPDATSKWETSS